MVGCSSRRATWWATEVRRLDQLEAEVHDLIAGLTDTSEDAFNLDWSYNLPPELARPVRQFVEARSRRQAAERDYAEAQVQAVDALTSAHVSVRDATELLDLSYQRVAQIRPHVATEAPSRRTSA
jgi:hypothetical protein